MKRVVILSYGLVLLVAFAVADVCASDSTKILIGSWSGKATAPDGGPPSGDIQVTFVRGEDGVLKGKIRVKAEGGLEYGGDVSDIKFENRIVSAKAIFKLGESPLEASVSGPMKGKKIEGNFLVISKGEKIGQGTFSITKDVPTK